MGLTLRVHVPPLRQGLVAQGCSTISHCSPERPSAHVQRYLSGAVFSQVPPCLQGSWVPQKFKSVRGRVEWRNYEICGYIRGSGIDIIDDTPVPTPRSPFPLVIAEVTHLGRTICHPSWCRRRISRRCRCRNHVCNRDRPCTRCTTDRASQVCICGLNRMVVMSLGPHSLIGK